MKLLNCITFMTVCLVVLFHVHVNAQEEPASGTDVARHGVLSQLGEHTPEGEIDFNTLADFVLDALREEIQKNGKEQIPIPDIQKDFKTKIKFVKVSGNFAAYNGWFRNLSTLARTGNVSITTDGNVHSLACSVGLGEIKLGYDHYTVKINNVGIALSGRVSGTVGTNSISFAAQVDLTDGKCIATLKEIRVVELNDVKLTLTGFGVLNSLASTLANKEIDKRKADIIKKIEFALAKDVSEALKKVKCP